MREGFRHLPSFREVTLAQMRSESIYA
jgi:hypothetical protein